MFFQWSLVHSLKAPNMSQNCQTAFLCSYITHKSLGSMMYKDRWGGGGGGWWRWWWRLSFSHNSKTTSWLDPRTQNKETPSCTERKSVRHLYYIYNIILIIFLIYSHFHQYFIFLIGEFENSSTLLRIREIHFLLLYMWLLFWQTASRGQHRLTLISCELYLFYSSSTLPSPAQLACDVRNWTTLTFYRSDSSGFNQ